MSHRSHLIHAPCDRQGSIPDTDNDCFRRHNRGIQEREGRAWTLLLRRTPDGHTVTCLKSEILQNGHGNIKREKLVGDVMIQGAHRQAPRTPEISDKRAHPFLNL